MRVLSKGRGPAVVFFHGPWGLTWDPFLDALARSFTVYAPGASRHQPRASPTTSTTSTACGTWSSATTSCWMRSGSREAMLVGHSFGGMVACEVAAARPARVGRLVLIDPIGLWRDDAPVTNWMLLNHGDLAGHVFHDPDGDGRAANVRVRRGSRARARPARTRLTWAMGATGKFIWPIPDKGLKKRIHRDPGAHAARLGRGRPARAPRCTPRSSRGASRGRGWRPWIRPGTRPIWSSRMRSSVSSAASWARSSRTPSARP